MNNKLKTLQVLLKKGHQVQAPGRVPAVEKHCSLHNARIASNANVLIFIIFCKVSKNRNSDRMLNFV